MAARSDDTGWRPTAALGRAIGGGLVIALVATATGRLDLLVVATPLVAIAVWSIVHRPSAPFESTVPRHARLAREGDVLALDVGWTPTPGIDRVGVVLQGRAMQQLDPPGGAVAAQAGADRRHLAITVRTLRWGRAELGPVVLAAETCWGGFRWPSTTLNGPTLTTLPVPAAFDSSAGAPDPAGLVGTHHARREGDGLEFASIRPFATGDRLRRIHWPVTLRTGNVHVTTSHLELDTHVMLVVDATSDIGVSGGIDGAASSLDRTVRGAGALAEHFLGRGDRVGLRSTGSRGFIRIPTAGGYGHLRRILGELAALATGTMRELRWSDRPLGIPPGGLVVVLSPLLQPTALDQIVGLARGHAAIVVVDTLPDDIVAQVAADEPAAALSWRIRLLQRREEIDQLQRRGIPVAPWRGPGSLDLVLRQLSRRARAPRSVVDR